MTDPLDRLNPRDLHGVVRVYADALKAHRESINRLNVYPVPDGDTGTNMSLTVASVLDELDALGNDGGDDKPQAMSDVCRAISHGSLMGARGNSGVILSQVMRGLTSTVVDDEVVDGALWAKAMLAASEAAYDAVMHPVEGTILTVVREAATSAMEIAEAGGDLRSVAEGALDSANIALENTPKLLPVLAEAGVVDSGGAGFVLFLHSVLNVIDGRPVPDPKVGEGLTGTEPPLLFEQLQPAVDGESPAEGELGVSDLQYEVMYFLEAPDGAINAFKDVWATIGGSIVVVGGDGLWNCHIHTNDIGAAIEAGIDVGRPRQIRVTDLREEVEEQKWVRDSEALPPEPASLSEPVPTAVVAVAIGDGIRRIFYSLGVRGMVNGGQTMNPSTAELLEVVESVPADEVVILPNNKNIVPVAEQVVGQTSKKVVVVATHGVAEGFASLLAYDPQSSAHENAVNMAAAVDAVTSGEVTMAVRDSTCDVGPISRGDWMGICRRGIVAVESSLNDACTSLLAELTDNTHEIATVIEGEGSSDATTRHIELWLADNFPDLQVEVHHGGQPLYPYLFGLE